MTYQKVIYEIVGLNLFPIDYAGEGGNNIVDNLYDLRELWIVPVGMFIAGSFLACYPIGILDNSGYI